MHGRIPHPTDTQRRDGQARWGLPWRLAAVIALGLTLANSSPVQAKTFHCGAGNVACLIAAINDANANGQKNTIRLAAGTYTLTAINNNTRGPNGLPSITSTLTIRGAGADTTIIERQVRSAPFRLAHVEPTGTLTLRGLTLRGGLAAPSFEDFLGIGGGIDNRGTLTILHSSVSDNFADFCCGGIGSSGTLLIDHSIISDNSSGGTGEGGGILGDGMLRITHSTITRNQGDGVSGGGIDFNGTLILTDSTVSENRGAFGGGILTFVGTTFITNTTIANNIANVGGGLRGVRATVVITNTTIANNIASRGGGLFSDSGQLGVPGATAGKCAVSPVAQNITFLPGAWRVRNARKISTCLKANVRGFLATLG